MRLPTNPREQGFGFNMTPMIDVVFLLIIFFLVSSHLASQEVQLELDLPTAASGQQPDAEARPRVTVNVLPEGVIQLGSEQVTPAELGRRLKYELSRARGDLEVRIRGDRTVPYEYVEPIMIACARAGAWNVTFAVTHRN